MEQPKKTRRHVAVKITGEIYDIISITNVDTDLVEVKYTDGFVETYDIGQVEVLITSKDL